MTSNKYKFLSQEALKAIACGIMLLDHIGVLLRLHWLRMIGRMAFPIFCFLLAEGAHYTKDPKKYALRLLICALLSEIPYDLFVGTGWSNQNVLFTLLLGFAGIHIAKRIKTPLLKVLVVLACGIFADLLRSDYGAIGVLLIVGFSLSREYVAMRYWLPGLLSYGLERYPTAALSLVPIFFYSGRKVSRQKWIQWGFYMFYPVHMVILALFRLVL